MVTSKGPPMTIYREGGWTTSSEKGRLREGFTKFLNQIPMTRHPKIVACGGRGQAFKSFKLHVRLKEESLPVLLVDSEELVSETSPWIHVASRGGDDWVKPDSATDEQLHLMTVITETWLLTDPSSLADYFGKNFDRSKIPTAGFEAITKDKVEQILRRATKDTTSGGCTKDDVFRLIATTNPKLVAERCPLWGKRFVDFITANC